MPHTIGIPVYNEEETLEYALESLQRDIQKSSVDTVETIVCINGCTDNSEAVARRSALKMPDLNIRVIEIEKGLISAQRAIIDDSSSASKYVLFYNADTKVLPGCTHHMFDAYKQDKPVITGEQVPFVVDSELYRILNFEALHPELFDQPRKYVIGRLFAIRKGEYRVPDMMVSDDMFISNDIANRHGMDGILRVGEAQVMYMGPQSIQEYHHKIRRYKRELRKLYDAFPEFRDNMELFQRDAYQERVRRLSLTDKSRLTVHDAIKIVCKFLVKYDNGETWTPLRGTKTDGIY